MKSRKELALVSAEAFKEAAIDRASGNREVIELAKQVDAMECILVVSYNSADGESVEFRLKNLARLPEPPVCVKQAGGLAGSHIAAANKGHPGMACEGCPHGGCPFEIAALLNVARRLARGSQKKSSLPSWYSPDPKVLVPKAFIKKWLGRIEGDGRWAVQELADCGVEYGYLLVETEHGDGASDFLGDVDELLLATGKTVLPAERVGLHELSSRIRFRFDKSFEEGRLPKGAWFIELEGRKLDRGEEEAEENAIALLSSMRMGGYVIVIGSVERIRAFRNSSPAVSVVFGNGAVKLPVEYDPEWFEIYAGAIGPLARTLPEGFERDFRDYVVQDQPLAGSSLALHLARLARAEGGAVLPGVDPRGAEDGSTSWLDRKLGQLVGLDSVKAKLKELEKLASYKAAAIEAGIDLTKLGHASYHMAFLGPPGTGKTTVSCMVGEILHRSGLLPCSRVTSVKPCDLISPYVSDTARQARKVILGARPGVLLIDEAYQLVADERTGRSHGTEALPELLTAMEEFDDLVIVFAGYEAEMSTLLDSNSGLRSRIAYTFRFSSLSPEELGEIYRGKLVSAGFSVEEAAVSNAISVCERFSGSQGFGNGRFVKRLIQETLCMKACKKGSSNWVIGWIGADDVPTYEEMASLSAAASEEAGETPLSARQLRRICVHEAGHALVRICLLGEAPVEVSVREDGGSYGRTLGRGIAGPDLTKGRFEKEIAACMAGAASEKVVYGDWSSGSGRDFERATELGIDAVATLGMGTTLVSYAKCAESPDTASLPEAVRSEVDALLRSGLERAEAAITANREALDAIAEQLEQRQVLKEGELLELWRQHAEKRAVSFAEKQRSTVSVDRLTDGRSPGGQAMNEGRWCA